MRNALVLGLLYLVVVLLFVISKMYGGFGPWFLFGASVLFVAYETINMRSRHREFKVTRKISAKRVRAGADIEMTLSVSLTDSPLLPVQWLRIEDDVPQKLAVRMNRTSWMVFPWRSRESQVRYMAKHVTRGVYRFSQVRITGGDMFGLLTWQVPVRSEGYLIVYPVTYPIRQWPKALQAQQGHRVAQGRVADDATKVVGVRDYVAGDRLSRIHWPASARTGVLRSKEFEHYVNNEMVFALDAGHRDADQEDMELALSAVASLVEYVYQANLPFGLLSFGAVFTEFPVTKGDVGFLQVMEHLAMVEANRLTEFHEEFWRFMTLPRQTAILLVTTEAKEDLLRLAVMAKERQLRIEMFLARTAPVSDTEQTTLSRLRTFGWQVHELHALADFDGITAGGIPRAHFLGS